MQLAKLLRFVGDYILDHLRTEELEWKTLWIIESSPSQGGTNNQNIIEKDSNDNIQSLNKTQELDAK